MKRVIIILVLTLSVIASGCSLGAEIPKINLNRLTVVDAESFDEYENKLEIENTISQYLKDNIGFKAIDGEIFEAHELYGTAQKENIIYAFMWILVEEYKLVDDEIVKGSGVSMPAVILIDNSNDKLVVTQLHTPQDGEYYTKSVEALFPKKYHERIFERSGKNQLSDIIKQKAINYFDTPDIVDNNKDDTEPGEYGKMIQTQGIYIGQIDQNSIEIVIEVDSLAVAKSFRFSEDAKVQFDTMNLSGSEKVNIVYWVNGYDQNVIDEISLSEKPDDEPGPQTEVEGIFKGQIDAGSIEVMIGDDYEVFRFTASGLKQFQNGMILVDDEVRILYEENDMGQKVISAIYNESPSVNNEIECIFEGRVDQGNIEVSYVEDGKEFFTVFKLSETSEVKFDSMDVEIGDEIRLIYNITEDGEKVAMNVEFAR